VQGRMEVPCQLTFVGMGKELKKIHCNLVKDFSALKTTACKEEMPMKLECKVEEAPSCSTSSCMTRHNTSLINSAAIDLNSNEDMVATDEDLTRDVWAMHGKHTLKLTDKATIEQGEELNDKHIQMPQYVFSKDPVPCYWWPRINTFARKEKRQLHSQYCANNLLQEVVPLDYSLNKI